MGSASTWRIVVDDLTDPRVHGLLRDHLAGMYETSPPESVHALDLDGLRAASVTVWTAWDGEQIAGCGALKQIDVTHGEVKSMRTADAYLRRGVAAALLTHMLAVARERGYGRVSLETGPEQTFAAAHRLYERFGFVPCGPFEGYSEDPFSRFFTLVL